MDRIDLANRKCTSVITGASAGIGAAVAVELAKRGSDIAIFARSVGGLEETAEKARAFGARVVLRAIDITDGEAVSAFARDLGEEYEGVHVLVNNAGAGLIGSFRQATLEEFKRVLDVNLWGVVVTTKAFLPLMEKAPAAHVSNVSSVWGLAAPAGKVPYSTSKFGVRGFTEALRHELEGSNVSAGVVFPGGIRTDITMKAAVAAAVDPEVAMRAARKLTAKYKTSPEDAAVAIVDSIVRRKGRLVVGSGASYVDFIARFYPSSYWNYLRQSFKEISDTGS